MLYIAAATAVRQVQQRGGAGPRPSLRRTEGGARPRPLNLYHHQDAITVIIVIKRPSARQMHYTLERALSIMH